MVAKRMRSQGGDSGRNEGTQAQTQDTKPNRLASQGSFYSLTLDEVQNQLGDLGKPLSSMNLDELLKNVWTAEDSNLAMGGIDYGAVGQQSVHQERCSSLNRESSLTMSRNLSNKTVEEVWQDIQQGIKRGSLDRKATLGEITLEDFLVKAGVVAESSPKKKTSGLVFGGVDAVILPHQTQWVNYPVPSAHNQQQQPNMLPVFMQGHSVQQAVSFGGSPAVDASFSETQISSSLSPRLGTLSDTQAPGRKRVAPGDIAERSVERRQKRMIKNRESAARSRARKQAYTQELENKVSRLEEENERLRRQKEWTSRLDLEPRTGLVRTRPKNRKSAKPVKTELNRENRVKNRVEPVQLRKGFH